MRIATFLLLALATGCDLGRGGHHPAAQLLSDDPEVRLLGVYRMDGAQMVTHLDQILALAASESEPHIRGQLIRHIGYTRDPRALAFLEARLDGPDQAMVISGLAAYGPEGCALLEQLLRESPGGVHVALEEPGRMLSSQFARGYGCAWELARRGEEHPLLVEQVHRAINVGTLPADPRSVPTYAEWPRPTSP